MKNMRQKLSTFAFALLACLPACLQAQSLGSKADDILGNYEVFVRESGEKVHLNFYQADDGDYEARIVWMEHPLDDLGKPRTDVQNPRADKRHIPLTHVAVVRKLRYDARSKEWNGGRVYDPTSGKTYRCAIEFENDSTMKVRAYIGFRILGRSLYWNRL